MRLFLIATLIIGLTTTIPASLVHARRDFSYTPKRKAVLLMDDEELALRQWSLDAVSKIMTFNHDNLAERLAYNKHLQTDKACRKFLWVLERFDINEAIDRKETVITSYDPKFPLNHTLERIGVDPAGKMQLSKLGYPEGTKIWDVHIPLSIEYSKKLKKQRYNFMARVRVLARSETIGDYVIIDWYTATGRNTMQPRNTVYYDEDDYDTCNNIDFVDVEHSKAGDE